MGEQGAVVSQQNLDRSCWVCFATDEDDRTAEWVRPCRCRGSTKWVHQSCLQRWVDEKQRGNSTARVACPQCNAEYLIVFPKLVSLVLIPPVFRSCWVCFATDEDDRTAEWVRPCRCRGSTKWVHQSCLQRWVDEKQRGNSTARVACPQCNAEYLIVFPKLGPVVYVLDLADRFISKAGPFAAAGIMVGSIYWTAVTYGAVTVMQVVGHKEGLDVMERADPLFLLIGLPTIPVMLILGKMIRWEDYVLRLWRKYCNKLQILNSIFPGIGCPVPRIPAEASPLADHVSATRILCGALVFPTIATIVGKLMFSSVNSNLQRTILGGIAFVAIKGAFKVYFKQQQYQRQAHRKILDFPEPEEA
ncbi:LOW QUALITY PROTEIN: E3 ubiquitin-protein ligase MARCHF5 [Pseudochaenichthys georgianus]|uniref:LOW QUALITY PROTEIN: E3 ubiquitin-protein ligase MARCHF5 n=1 Tax=Pseudochaenichthys georgianus TaxID=52239 RepID=UPI00146F2BA5|nr:LOW QUALITY PROTEIN: E3 ubiquitin-protein ligase MARCH5 [Pseudochaenichthys georgianus]